MCAQVRISAAPIDGVRIYLKGSTVVGEGALQIGAARVTLRNGTLRLTNGVIVTGERGLREPVCEGDGNLGLQNAV
jgi:hypothetical protein